MLVRDVMTKKVVTAGTDTAVAELARLMAANRISGLPIVDAQGHVLGMVSEGDLLHRVETGTERRRSWWLELFTDPDTKAREFVKQEGRKAGHVMSRPVISVGVGTSLARVADLMEEHGVKRLPVIRDGKLVGIVSRADLIRALAEATPAEPARRDDRALDAALRKRIRSLDWLNSTYLNFEVDGGIVSVWGFVESAEQQNALRAAIESVPGVRGLEDRLTLKPLHAHV